MHSRVRFGVIALSLAVACGTAVADLPLHPQRTIEFVTTEGTWMSADVSPDGQTIVFDLLGDLYLLGIEGGQAKALTRDPAFDSQPVFSPDGNWILFVSDRCGAENFWTVAVDGSSFQQWSFNTGDRMLVSPAWSSDGNRIYGSVFRADLNGYELWTYDNEGAAELEVSVKSSSDQPRSSWTSALGATASPDGRFLYYAHHLGQLDPDIQRWTIHRKNLETGASEVVIQPADARGRGFPGSFFRPAVSPDNRYLVYGSRYRAKTGLRIRRLDTGEDRWFAFPVQRDQLHATSVQGLLPGYAFTPDGTSIVLSRNGGIYRHSLVDDSVKPIPFEAPVHLELGPQLRIDIAHDTGPVRARLIQHPVQSPDGRFLAFSALGRLYVQPLREGASPGLLVELPPGQFHPEWSEDGSLIVFVTWTATDGGHVWTAPANGKGAPVRHTEVADFYSYPSFASDMEAILALRSSHADRIHRYMEFGALQDAALISIAVGEGGVREVVRGRIAGKPQTTDTANSIALVFDDGLNAIALPAGERRTLAGAVGYGWYFEEGPGRIDELAISPNGRWVLAKSAAQQLHLFPLPNEAGATVDLTDPATRQRQLTTVGADFFGWADEGRTITWALGSTYYRCPLRETRSAASDARDSGAVEFGCGDIESFEIVVEAPRDTPRGKLVLKDAAVLTMAEDGVIEPADIHIENDRIKAVVPSGQLRVPDDADAISVKGHYIVPGFIDAHMHLADIRRGVFGMESWGATVNLAYGVTTSFDPSPLSIDMLAYEDLVDAGVITGSRIHSTGPAVFSFHNFQSLTEVEDVVRRYRDHYRTRNIKMYRTGNRRVRQWVAMAAESLDVLPTTEGALAMKLGLTQVLDGFPGFEHELAALPLARDVVELMARSGVSYTPTLIISAGPDAQDFFITRQVPWRDPKINRFWPDFAIDKKLREAPWHALEEYSFPRAAAEAAKILRAGGVVAVGSHGDIPGLGFHWEMQALAMGGMQPMEILLAATMNSAKAIGRHGEFGSIQAGKYADLVILKQDPRTDIANTLAISHVMKNGRLYDGDTLDEVWPRARKLPRPFYHQDRDPMK